jgi:hypothetical protein
MCFFGKRLKKMWKVGKMDEKGAILKRRNTFEIS